MTVFQVDLTIHGKEMMRNFLYDICGLSGTFTIKDRETKCLEEIVEQVGDNKVLVSLSLSSVSSSFYLGSLFMLMLVFDSLALNPGKTKYHTEKDHYR